jgi:DNA-binding HxlR family transcriptional regulator
MAPNTKTPYDKAAAESVIDTVDRLGSTWRITVLYRLRQGETLFADLQRSTEASAETLGSALAALEDGGFVDRRIDDDSGLETDYQCSQTLTDAGAHESTVPEAPLATYYSLTPKGSALEPVFAAVEEWADEWLDDSDISQ